MNQRDVEINTRILVQAQNDAVIVERLKRRITEIEHFDTFNSMAEVKHELQKILGDQKWIQKIHKIMLLDTSSKAAIVFTSKF